jgi:hypothetical protein
MSDELSILVDASARSGAPHFFLIADPIPRSHFRFFVQAR